MKKKLEEFCKKNLIVIFFASVILLGVLCCKAISTNQNASVAATKANGTGAEAETVEDSAEEETGEKVEDTLDGTTDETIDEAVNDEEDAAEGLTEETSKKTAEDTTEKADDIAETETAKNAEDDNSDETVKGASKETVEDTVEDTVEEPKKELEKDSVKDTKEDTKKDSVKSSAEDKTETKEDEKVINPNYKKNQFAIYVNRAKNFVKVCRITPTGDELRVKTFACSVGRKGHATPLGTFKTSQYYDWRLMVDNTYARYAIRFNGHIMFHSVPYVKATSDTLEWEEFNKLGSPASLGCVRLKVSDVKWIYDNCKAGTKVVVYDDYDEEDANVPETIKIDENSPNRDWDPSDPDPKSPWNVVEDED